MPSSGCPVITTVYARQWQLTLSDGTHSVGSSEFLLMDDQGPRWLTDTPAHLLDTPAHMLDTNNNGNNHKQEEAA